MSKPFLTTAIIVAALATGAAAPEATPFAARAANAQAKTPATQLLAICIQLGHIREFVAKGMGFCDEEGIDV